MAIIRIDGPGKVRTCVSVRDVMRFAEWMDLGEYYTYCYVEM